MVINQKLKTEITFWDNLLVRNSICCCFLLWSMFSECGEAVSCWMIDDFSNWLCVSSLLGNSQLCFPGHGGKCRNVTACFTNQNSHSWAFRVLINPTLRRLLACISLSLLFTSLVSCIVSQSRLLSCWQLGFLTYFSTLVSQRAQLAAELKTNHVCSLCCSTKTHPDDF